MNWQLAASGAVANRVLEDGSVQSALVSSLPVDTEFDPYIAPPPSVPSEVTMRQARLALLGAGKLDAVNAAIAALPEPQRTVAQIAWDYSSTVQRHQGLVLQLGAALGLGDAELDALFINADAL